MIHWYWLIAAYFAGIGSVVGFTWALILIPHHRLTGMDKKR